MRRVAGHGGRAGQGGGVSGCLVGHRFVGIGLLKVPVLLICLLSPSTPSLLLSFLVSLTYLTHLLHSLPFLIFPSPLLFSFIPFSPPLTIPSYHFPLPFPYLLLFSFSHFHSSLPSSPPPTTLIPLFDPLPFPPLLFLSCIHISSSPTFPCYSPHSKHSPSPPS